MRARCWVFASIAVGFSACGGGGGSNSGTAAPQVPAPVAETPPSTSFTDATSASGISFVTGFASEMANVEIPIILPSGVAAADYDADGDIDVFIVRGDLGPNLLYVNLGNLTFAERAVEAGLAFTKSAQENYRHSSPAFADIDGDGDHDVLLPGLDGDPTKVYANDGNGFFNDVTATQHFGLAANAQADTVRVVWPDGDETTLQAVPANQARSISQLGL